MLCISGLSGEGRITKAGITYQENQQVITKEKMDTVLVKDAKDQVIVSRFTIYPGTSITTKEDAVGKHSITMDMQVNDEKILKEAKSIGSVVKPQIYVESPTSIITTYLESNKVDEVILSLTISNAIWKSAFVEWKSIELEREVWEQVKSTGKRLIYQVLDEKGIERFAWTFSGEYTTNIDANIDQGFNLIAKIRNATNSEKQIITMLTTKATEPNIVLQETAETQQEEYLVLEFNQEGTLPIPGELWIALDNMESIHTGYRLLEWVEQGKMLPVTIDCNNGIRIPIQEPRTYLFEWVP